MLRSKGKIQISLKRKNHPEEDASSLIKKQNISQHKISIHQETKEKIEKKETEAKSTTKAIFEIFAQGDILLGLTKKKLSDKNTLIDKGFTYLSVQSLNSETLEEILKGESIKSEDSAVMKHAELLKKNLSYLKR